MLQPGLFFSHLECSSCNAGFDHTIAQTFCPSCKKPLLARYDLRKASVSFSRERLGARIHSLWRYAELLPVRRAENIVSLGEGWSPMIPAPRLAHALGIRELIVKDESFNPTASFKARGLCMAVSRAKELGIRDLCMPSAGNAGGALAAYAARAGITAHVFVPRDTPEVNVREVPCFGGHIRLVEGVISDAGKRMTEEKSGTSWFDVSTMKEPYRLEGKKTMGYEIAEQLQWTLPDVVVYPTGGGTGLIGMWKAFEEMEQLGWIGSARPRMVAVQSTGCAPVVRAFNGQRRVCEFWNGASTLASGLRVPLAFADEMIMNAVYESGGTAVAVDDPAILDELRFTAKLEGILLCPEGAACVAAIRSLAEQGTLRGDESVVMFNTGSGYKYLEVLRMAVC